MRNRPQVIFLDAVGTLFGVKGSVGQVYGEIARQFGVDVPTETLDRAFYQSFKQAGAPVTTRDPATIPAQEFAWWQAIATQTFTQAGAIGQFADFAAFFTQLYAYFATPAPWIVYPDVRPALNHWQQQAIPMGILSNFDSRLYAVLQALELNHFFTSITISTEAGAAKPNRQIFEIALKKHRCLAAAAWHIGDSYREDYEAARSCGMQGIWLRRQQSAPD